MERVNRVLEKIPNRLTATQQLIEAAKDAEIARGKELDKLIAVAGENLPEKLANARKEAILDIKQADEEAITSMIKNRERLADASIFHSDRANAIFLDHLAKQKSV